MERPQSRGRSALAAGGLSKAPLGSLIPPPERPITANRGTDLSGPPTTRNILSSAGGLGAGAPPGTAYRRLSTAQGNNRLGTALQVEARPITNHGISGLKGGNQTAGRQVLDKAYFVNELRQKRQDIISVTQQLKDELASLEQKQSLVGRAEKRLAELQGDVRGMQDKLAMNNMVLDKAGSRTPPKLISSETNMLKEHNDRQRQRVHDMLTQRLAVEQQTKELENKMAQVQERIEDRLASMSSSARHQYNELLVEQKQLIQDAAKFEEMNVELEGSLEAAEGELNRNTVKQRALELQGQIKQLAEKKYELQVEEERARLSPEEQREVLLARVKRDNAEVEQLTATVKETQEQVKALEARVGPKGPGSQAAAEEAASRREKYEELLNKERELNKFLDSFPSLKASKIAELRAAENEIVAVLERLTKLQDMANVTLPSQRKFKELQEELEYKKVQLEHTHITQGRLKEQLKGRKEELQKIDVLEEKILSELAALEGQVAQVKGSLSGMEDIELVQDKGEEKRMRLEKQRAELMARRDGLKESVADKQWKYQAKLAQLRENSVHAGLERMEGELRRLMESNYQISENVKNKESQTRYLPIAEEITNLVEDLTAINRSVVVG